VDTPAGAAYTDLFAFLLPEEANMAGTHRWLVTLVVATSAIFTSAAEGSAQGPPLSAGFEVGAPFPSIALPALEDGRPRSIADFRGKKVILHVFASW
jgi:hypothetical protein